MKHAVLCNYWGLRLRLVTLCVAVAVSFDAPAKELKFEQVFSDQGEPHTLHYKATFTSFASKDIKHQMEVWRDGELRVKRRTDDAIETYVFRKQGNSEFHMSILDLKKRIHTQIDRTNLYRIGNFTDWFDLSHGLKHPKGKYQVTKSKEPQGAPKAIQSCHWHDLTQDNRTTHVCWSTQSHLPLLILAHDGTVVWQVTALDRLPIPAKNFEIHDEGFINNDANQDIESD